jgi:hypothetical protein
LGLDLPEGSIIHADKGYTDYHYEDLLSKRLACTSRPSVRRDPSGRWLHGRSF